MRQPAAVLIAAGIAALPLPAWAHGDEHGPWHWSFDPWALGPLLLAVVAYGVALRRLRGSPGGARAITTGHVAAFVAGIVVVVLALESPLDSLGDQLFSAHMVQHLLLMLAAAPLCVAGRAGIMFLWALPAAWRGPVGRWTAHGASGRAACLLTHPLTAWVLYCGLFVFWHLPAPYAWALGDETVHAVEHACFFLSAYAFWSVVIEPGGRRRLDYGTTLLYVAAAAVLGGLPGALLIFAPHPLYPGHAAGVAHWGLTLLEDQQLAGVIMWVPAGIAYLTAVSVLFLLWLREADRRAGARLRQLAPLAGVLLLVLVLPACQRHEAGASAVTAGGDADAGADLIGSYGCGGCHVIPGIPDADGMVGPPLDHMARRVYVAGLLRNTPDNMVHWLTRPQAVVPGNAMPDMGVTEAQARDIAAYLDTLQ